MINDSIFIQGKSHNICQDYAISGITSSGITYLITSDGCSLLRKTDINIINHPTSDVAARIICHCAKHVLETENSDNPIPDNFLKIFKINLNMTRMGLGLPDNYLTDATFQLLVIKNNKYQFFRFGDGFFITKTKNLYNINYTTFEPNMPYLTSYWYQDKEIEHQKLVKTTHINLQYNNNFELINEKKDINIINEPQDINDIDMFILTSDGLYDIYDNTNTKINIIDSIKLIFPFKSFNESFIKRKVLNGMMRKMKIENLYFNDDFTLAGISI